MRDLKQSTAVTIKFGAFVDSTDGSTAETGLTIQKADVRLSKNGGNMAAASADQGVADAGAAHDELGYYDLSLDTTDTGTLGHLRVMVTESGALPVWDDFNIVTANVWDSLYSTDVLDVNVTTIANDAITAASINTGALTADAFTADAIVAATLATGALTADAFAADAIVAATLATGAITADAFAADAIVAATLATNAITNDAIDASAVTEIQSGLATATALATVDDFIDTEVAAILAAVDTEVAAIKTKTDYLPSATAGAAGGVFIAGSNAATSITTALTANITGNLSGSVGSVTGAVGSVTGAVGSVTGSVGSVASGGITAASIATNAIDADALATDAVTEIQSGLATTVNVSAVETDTQDIQSRLPAALTANGNIKSSLVEILTTALTETAGYLAAGFKKFFNVLTPVMTVESVNQTGDSYALVSTEVAEILADTNELQTDWVNGGRLDLLIDAVKAKTDLIPASPAAVGSAMTLADDAITSAKFDESTAYPVKSADTGATQIARVGADADTLETLSDQIDGISAATIADAVWDEAIAGHAGVGSTGAALSAATAPTAAAVADAVWDEALAGHAGVGSAGEALSAAGGAADPLLNTVPGTYASGTAGAALGRIGSGQITTVSPVAQNGNVQTYMGQDYDNADGYALDWTDTSAQWPDLTSATVSVKVFTRSAGTLTFTGSVVTATGSSKKVRLELTDVQTLTIPSGSYRFLVLATQADSDIYVLVEGVWESKPTT